MQFNVVELGPMLQPPPWTGSDWDQSTVEYVEQTDTSLMVCLTNFVSQSFSNDRNNMTGHGIVVGYIGSVTNGLVIGIATREQRDNHPFEPSKWLRAGELPSSAILPNKWYYVHPTEEYLIDTTTSTPYYLVCATNEQYNATNCWMLAGISAGPYDKGHVDSFDQTTWKKWGNYDTIFWSWTKTSAIPCYEHNNETDCVNHGCEWCGTYCADTCNGNGNGCDSHLTKTACEDANCFWYQKYIWEGEKCHSKEQNMLMDYLPIIFIGAGAVLIAASFATREKAQPHYPPPQPHYPPPQYYQPQKHTQHYQPVYQQY